VTDLHMIVLSRLSVHPTTAPRRSLRRCGPTWTRSPSSVRTSCRPGTSSRLPGT